MATATGSSAVATVKDAGDVVATAKRPVLTAGAAAAGLAGGVALGTRLRPGRGGLSALVRPRRRVLGVPIGRKSGLLVALETLSKVSSASDDLQKVREELEQANRRSPVEVLLDGLTHRRGAHRRES